MTEPRQQIKSIRILIVDDAQTVEDQRSDAGAAKSPAQAAGKDALRQA